jgi:UPF0755 protein
MFKLISWAIFLLIIIFGVWFLVVLLARNKIEQAQTFVIAEGQGVNTISQDLKEAKLIKNQFVFETWLWAKRAETKVVAGVYSFPQNISIRQLVNILIIGPGSSQQSVTLLEGWDRNDLSKYFNKHNLSGDEFLALTKKKTDWEDDYDFLADAPATASLEGYLFPDTYYIDKQTTITMIVQKTLNNFAKKLNNDLRQAISQQGKTIFEVVTLASIVEKEVPQTADKKMIADIFLKRLDASIGLQSDATINFITGKGLVQPTLEDLKNPSFYNTYKYRGLPPGPIANPGLESIKAVIYPTSNPYYYFLTTKEGEVIYSRTYEEHLANKKKYLD